MTQHSKSPSPTTTCSQPELLPDLPIEKGLDKELGEKDSDPFLVILEDEDDPQSLPLIRKWVAVIVISMAALCVTSSSSAAAFTEVPMEKDLSVSHTVSVLSVSLFVFGLGCGPPILGPLSEVYGRNKIYRTFYGLFFAFTLPVTFAPNIAVLLIFRFLGGFGGSAFLSVAGGSVSDLFSDSTVATPMAVYTISPFIGPVLGPLMSGFIVQNLEWRWVYRLLSIWSAVQYVFLWLCVPETYEPVILQRKAERLRKRTGDSRYWAPMERREYSLSQAILFSCSTPFKLLAFDRMVLLLDIWTALLLGILYLTFQAFPIIFEQHNFDLQEKGLSFIGIGLGMIFAMLTQPYWNMRLDRAAAENDGKAPPEARLLTGKAGAILVPMGLYIIAFTTYPHVHWVAPMIGSIPFGAGVCLSFSAVFSYLVTAYRPIAASAMASNSALRSSFAAAFPLFSNQMYDRLGTVGATALLAGLTTLMIPLPFVFSRIGRRLRHKSRFAAK